MQQCKLIINIFNLDETPVPVQVASESTNLSLAAEFCIESPKRPDDEINLLNEKAAQ
jgi:hypothetical protein